MLDYLETVVPESGFMFGPEPGIADLAIGCPFLNASYADFEVDAGRWPKTAAYVGRLLSHDAFERRRRQDREMMQSPPG